MPLLPCIEKVGLPKGISDYILSKKELHMSKGLDEAAAEKQAINEFKNETVNNLADLHKQVGNNKFEKNAPTIEGANALDVRQQTQNGEGMGIGNSEPSIPTGKEEGQTTGEKEGIGITHADTKDIRIENKLPEYEKTPQTVDQWNAEADKRIKNGELPTLLKKMRDGNPISDVEQVMMGKHIALLDEEVNKNPSNANISALKNAVDLSDSAGGSAWGRSGRARQERFVPDESLGAALIKEMESMGVDELPEDVKGKVIKEHEELASVRVELEKANLENERLQKELSAKNKIASIKKEVNEVKKERKSHTDYVKERSDSFLAAREALKKLRSGQSGLGVGIPLARELAAVAPHMAKIVKSLIEEGVDKLEDIVDVIHKEFKSDIPDLKKSDVLDIMSGVYNEKKPKISELSSKLRDLKTEAILLKKLSDARLGKDPVNTKAKVEKSRRIIDLENKIKEVRKRRKDENPIEGNDEGKLASKRKAIEKNIEEIKKDIKEGRFEKEEKVHPIRLDKKTQALQDRLIQLEGQQAIRRAKNDYEKQHWITKAWDTFWQISGLKRLVGAAVDFSIPFRQASPITMNPFKARTTLKAFANMFDKAFSPNAFKRFQYTLEKSDLGRMFTHFGGVFSNPTEVKMERREEEFSNSLLSRVHQKIEAGNNEKLKTAANIAEKIWFSERAAAAFLNTARIEQFTNKAKSLAAQRLTPENSPEAYKDAVKWVMDITGRGNLIKALEDSHAGRVIANRAYFGARLMAAKINMLNPATYIKLKPEVRAQAIRDMIGYTSGLVMTGLAGMAVGGTVSFNPDDPDFLQLRFGDKVYDISGGSAAYVRTFLRFLKGVKMQIQSPGSKEANSYTGFAGRSIMKSLVTNKLAPNTAYLLHFFTGKSGQYDENGKLKPFDPLEVAKIYPLYVDGTVQAFKKGGITDALAMLIPDLFGIGTQQYDKKGGTGGGGGASGGFSKHKQPKNH